MEDDGDVIPASGATGRFARPHLPLAHFDGERIARLLLTLIPDGQKARMNAASFTYVSALSVTSKAMEKPRELVMQRPQHGASNDERTVRFPFLITSFIRTQNATYASRRRNCLTV